MLFLEKSNKGFAIGRLNIATAKKLGWGIPERWVQRKDDNEIVIFSPDAPSGHCVCMECNEVMGNDIRYIAVLHDTICEKCFDEWHNRATRYFVDAQCEKQNIETLKHCCKEANIKYEECEMVL